MQTCAFATTCVQRPYLEPVSQLYLLAFSQIRQQICKVYNANMDIPVQFTNMYSHERHMLLSAPCDLTAIVDVFTLVFTKGYSALQPGVHVAAS